MFKLNRKRLKKLNWLTSNSQISTRFLTRNAINSHFSCDNCRTRYSRQDLMTTFKFTHAQKRCLLNCPGILKKKEQAKIDDAMRLR